MNKHLIYLLLSLLLLSRCGNKELEIAKNPIDFKAIEPQGINGICSLGASLCNFDKVAILTYLNQENIEGHIFDAKCFNKKGKQLFIPTCYSTLPKYVENNLFLDSIKKNLPFWIENSNGKISMKRRENLKQYLDENEIFLLDNKRLDATMLPSSDYYLFVDWFYFVLEGIGESLSKMDSLANLHPDKVTLIFIHASNPKSFSAE